MPWVISDSSTLIHLAAIDRLALLKDFYGKITLPPAVWREVIEEGKGKAGAVEIEKARQTGWIEVVSPEGGPLLHLLRRDLDEGEAEVIALALGQQADLVLLDESEARRIAELYGLPKTGLIGILIRAKREGKVHSLQIELDKLRYQAGFWIEEGLYHQALHAVGEE
ncbi:MAG: DUF3368 domain-containing protein [Candidatus Tectomicrobia bacterium]|uniref:DUF3368 domain-containing protein n=1 Tax=Tectimicrobiota bacterium TaxID=2528274 RepID=A0A932CLJ4_UNCTE|nr:DUF3368 domain-containing protein [Candidatus Tectomicrobia bacterium]